MRELQMHASRDFDDARQEEEGEKEGEEIEERRMNDSFNGPGTLSSTLSMTNGYGWTTHRDRNSERVFFHLVPLIDLIC